MLVWTDLETTGLDPDKCDTLEVAAIITDDKLNEVARFSSVIYWWGAESLSLLEVDSPESEFYARAASVNIDPVVAKMHTKNGLWKECARADAPARDDVDARFARFLADYSLDIEKYTKDGETKTRVVRAQLAGSTISFDRSFMASDLPLALAELHYRNVDVSTLNELGRRFWPTVYAARPKKGDAHRGMADIEESLLVLRHYLANLEPKAIAPIGMVNA